MDDHKYSLNKKGKGSRLTLLSLLTLVNLNNTDGGGSNGGGGGNGGGTGGTKGPFQNQISIYKALKLNDETNNTK
jgi:hypothetical protein